MASQEIEIIGELFDALEESFRQEPIIDDEGRRYLIEQQVDRLDGLEIRFPATEVLVRVQQRALLIGEFCDAVVFQASILVGSRCNVDALGS